MRDIDRLVKVLSKLDIPKGQVNTFGGYNYRSADDIIKVINPVIEAAGATLTIDKYLQECAGRAFVMAEVELRLGDEVITKRAPAEHSEVLKGMTSGQISGSTGSYAAKYALQGLIPCQGQERDLDYLNNGTLMEERAVEIDAVVKPENSREPTVGDNGEQATFLNNMLRDVQESSTEDDLNGIVNGYMADAKIMGVSGELKQAYVSKIKDIRGA
jgi:hypothetical protein